MCFHLLKSIMKFSTEKYGPHILRKKPFTSINHQIDSTVISALNQSVVASRYRYNIKFIGIIL